MSKSTNRIVVGLDIGTSKIVTIVGEVSASGQMGIIGLGSHPSIGLKKGVVVNIESTVQSIQRSVQEAELMAGCQIHDVYAGIAGSHIKSMNSHGVVAIKDREVKAGDIQRVIDAAKAVKVSSDQDFIHVIPQEYIIDEQDGIKEPIGMSGVRLEAKVHLITGAVSAAQNIIKCIERCELKVNELVLEQLASSCSVLIEDEKDLGVCLVDTGGGTTDIAIFKGGAIRYTAVIPIAGDQVTNDIAVAFRTPTMNAEEIKIKSACALEELTKPEEMIDVPGVGERPSRKLKRETLASVVHPRYEELFKLVLGKIKESGYESVISAGVVLTGGSAKMEGAVDLAEEIFHMPVRLGLPQQVEGLKDVVSNPIHATGVGLLLHGMQDTRAEQEQEQEQEPVWNQIKNWFQEAF